MTTLLEKIYILNKTDVNIYEYAGYFLQYFINLRGDTGSSR